MNLVAPAAGQQNAMSPMEETDVDIVRAAPCDVLLRGGRRFDFDAVILPKPQLADAE